MAFKDFPKSLRGIELLQRSLERGRLGHAYLFSGHTLEQLEALGRTLAKTLNCQNPNKKNNIAIDCCDECVTCKKIDGATHPDIHWARAESKTRIVTVDQMRELMREMQLKPSEAEYKVAIVAGADRLKTEAGNAFLKTLEEPPPGSVLILLTIEPQRILETLVSRCLRLSFYGEGQRKWSPGEMELVTAFSSIAGEEQKGLLARYRLLDVLLGKLTTLKEQVEAEQQERSPLERYKEAEKDLQEKWEDELKAATEAEYRRHRSGLLLALQHWLRDIWLKTLQPSRSTVAKELLHFPEIPATDQVAKRISTEQARENLQTLEQLQRWLYTNVQEALALELGLLKLHF
jgi:DNA polymerase-3 subunit delta'